MQKKIKNTLYTMQNYTKIALQTSHFKMIKDKYLSA
jgi:hypothetical protein